MNSKKVFLEWGWIDQQVTTLGEIIKESVSEFAYISGIPRGGLIPGAYLSHYLGMKYIPYNEAKQLPIGFRKQVLVVDDICDSGMTLLEASEFGFQTAALSMRYSSPFIPEFYSIKIETDDWLVFPWEKLDSVPMQDYLVDRK
jgi:hypoxanthine phosphoribosyltransferase